MRNYWLPLATLAFFWAIEAVGEEASPAKIAPLPEGNSGIAAKYPGDRGIGKDPAVVFADDFETGDMSKWDSRYGKPHITHEAENVHRGEAAVEMVLEWPRKEKAFNNGLMQHFRPGFDVLFYRYYAKFGKDTELFHGGTHNGGAIFASTMETNNVKAGVRADGRNQFTARLDTWRPNDKISSPGHLCLYSYHPEQAVRYGDLLFPSGRLYPEREASKCPYSKENFVERPDMIPEQGRWYCYEIMVVVNTPGQHDGRLAFWVDGKLTGDFPNFRVRDVEELKANMVNVSFYTQNPKVHDGCAMWYDDVVAATSYIGPMAEEVTPLPEGNNGIAAKYPGDRGIEKDPAVVFADDFETGDMSKWDTHYGSPHITHDAENVHSGKTAVEMLLDWPRTEKKFNNGLMQHFHPGFDVIFYRYYAKFGKDTELFDGGTHAGGAIFATTMPTENIKAGLRSDGHNQFTARHMAHR